MRRLIFSLICSSGNAANVLKPTNVGIPSSQIRILYPAHSERFGFLRTLADSARLSLIKTATPRSNPMELQAEGGRRGMRCMRSVPSTRLEQDNGNGSIEVAEHRCR